MEKKWVAVARKPGRLTHWLENAIFQPLHYLLQPTQPNLLI
jgi:hypothetical protein